ncbi:MAG TPA: DUF3943 domain-containing protein [Methylomirabilota bacterium]|jgi:hypothetical protein
MRQIERLLDGRKRSTTRRTGLVAGLLVGLCIGSTLTASAADGPSPVSATSVSNDCETNGCFSLRGGDERSTTSVLGPGAFSLLSRDPSAPGAIAAADAVRSTAEDAKAFLWRALAPLPPPGRDWKGLGLDTALLLGYEIVVSVPIYLTGDGADKGQPKGLGEIWWDNVRHPQWDSDAWWVNYVAHPYVGGAYYIRARERGFGAVGSFVYAAFLSTMFEYGVEAFFEPPSYQDLIVTPVAGALVGALIFEPLRNHIKAKPERVWYDKALLMLTDPLGAANGMFAWLFGVTPNFELQLRPLSSVPDGSARRLMPSSRASAAPPPSRGMGLELTVRY